jgi:hypothetical protein
LKTLPHHAQVFPSSFFSAPTPQVTTPLHVDTICLAPSAGAHQILRKRARASLLPQLLVRAANTRYFFNWSCPSCPLSCVELQEPLPATGDHRITVATPSVTSLVPHYHGEHHRLSCCLAPPPHRRVLGGCTTVALRAWPRRGDRATSRLAA